MPSTAVGATEKSRPMVGRRTFTIVVSSALMKIAAVKTTLTAAFSLIRARMWCSDLQRRPIVRTLTNILVPSANGRCAVRPKTGSDAVDAILYAAHRIRTATDGVLREHGLSLSGLKLLKALGEGDRSMRELSQVLHVSPRTVTDLIDGLEGHGLVTRCAHPSDRRVTMIRRSEAGAVETREASIASERVAAAAISDLSPAEQDTLRQLLERVGIPALTP